MKMISTKSNNQLHNALPLVDGVPNWPGVQVVLTQRGEPAFNLGTHVGDHLPDVEIRRSTLQAHLGVPIVWLNQVHGCNVLDASDFLQKNLQLVQQLKQQLKQHQTALAPVADASVSTSSSMALAIMTADCLPVVFAAFDEKGRAIGVAAAHAGWRGLHAGVLQAAALQLRKMCAISNTQIKAWMGPAIGPQSFEVGEDVFNAFVEQNKLNESCFNSSANPAKYLANIYELARVALHGIGVNQIEGGGLDTFTDSRWFSHRRAQQLVQPQGRFATLIRLLPAHDA